MFKFLYVEIIGINELTNKLLFVFNLTSVIGLCKSSIFVFKANVGVTVNFYFIVLKLSGGL